MNSAGCSADVAAIIGHAALLGIPAWRVIAALGISLPIAPAPALGVAHDAR